MQCYWTAFPGVCWSTQNQTPLFISASSIRLNMTASPTSRLICLCGSKAPYSSRQSQFYSTPLLFLSPLLMRSVQLLALYCSDFYWRCALDHVQIPFLALPSKPSQALMCLSLLWVQQALPLLHCPESISTSLSRSLCFPKTKLILTKNKYTPQQRLFTTQHKHCSASAGQNVLGNKAKV